MVYCTNCGNQVPDDIKFCTSCGASIVITTTTPPVQQEQVVQQPTQQPAPAPISTTSVYKEEPISTGGYVGIMFLLIIPILNLLLLIIWACGGCRTINKRNLSRAILLWMLIGVILTGLLFLAGGLLFGDQIDALKELFGTSIINQ